MPLIPQNHYARRARQSRIATKAAANAGARQAHAQLKAACEALDQADRPVLRLRGYERPGPIEPDGVTSAFMAGDSPPPLPTDGSDEDDGCR